VEDESVFTFRWKERKYSVRHLEKSWFQCLLAVNVEVVSMKIYMYFLLENMLHFWVLCIKILHFSLSVDWKV